MCFLRCRNFGTSTRRTFALSLSLSRSFSPPSLLFLSVFLSLFSILLVILSPPPPLLPWLDIYVIFICRSICAADLRHTHARLIKYGDTGERAQALYIYYLPTANSSRTNL